ncbi:MAG: hypothetical protein J0L78_13160 [Planctomycetes bacterium]|nr:hypothetical protein [Planctomycetota bacterium]
MIPTPFTSTSSTPQASPTTISAASLPPDLRRVVDQVLKKSGLWPAERADVESELAAHFTDGLASGASPEQLAIDFGDPAAAAKLIRRSKIRNRSFRWKVQRAIRLGVIGTTVLVVGAYTLVAIRFYIGSPTISRNIRNELNAPILAVPKAQRAWPVYRNALSVMVNPPSPGLDNSDPAASQRAPISPFVSPAGAKTNQAALAEIRRGASLPALGAILNDPEDRVQAQHLARLSGQKNWESTEYPLPPDDSPAVHILLPQLGTLRSFARLLAQDARDSFAAGNGQQGGEDLVAMARIAMQSREAGFLISDLVSLAIGDLAMANMRRALTQTPELLSDAALGDFAAALRSMGPRERLVRFDSERLSFEDSLQRSFTDDGNGDGRLTPAGVRYLASLMEFGPDSPNSPANSEFVSAPLQASIGPGRKAIREQYFGILQRVEDWGKEPAWRRSERPVVDSKPWSVANPLSFISVLLPAITNAVEAADRFDTSREATLAIIDIELFRRKHGRLPEQLAEVFGDFKPKLPLDLADGQPLRYKRVGDSYTLYSLGSNKQDDGGTPAKNSSEESQISSFRYLPPPAGIDWVFFPWIEPVDASPTASGVTGS